MLLNVPLYGSRLTREHNNVLILLSKFYRASITAILYMHLSAQLKRVNLGLFQHIVCLKGATLARCQDDTINSHAKSNE